MSDDGRGLRAVARVRAVRERDSKLGLQQAARIAQERALELARREDELDAAPAFTGGSAGAFLVARQSLGTMATETSQASDRAELGRDIATESLGRWLGDRSRLRAVELLSERRAERRRAELAQLERRDLDEIAGRSWLRAAASRERA